MAMNDNREVTYEIVEEIGIISSHPTGWTKEINMVSWNGNSPKYDIRDWSPDHAQMGRGITLHEKEMRMILQLLSRRPRSYRVGKNETDMIDLHTSEKESELEENLYDEVICDNEEKTAEAI